MYLVMFTVLMHVCIVCHTHILTGTIAYIQLTAVQACMH